MTHGQSNAAFLRIIGKFAARTILDAVAGHYGITRNEARDEVTSDDAEHLLDYLTDGPRSAASMLMQRFGFATQVDCC